MSGKWDPVPDILRRPILGGTWSADTAGSHGIYFNAMAHDINHKIIGSPLWEFSGLYYLNAGRWYSMPYPSAIPSYDNVTAIACDSSGGTLAAFDTYDFTLNNDIGLGVYCTHDYGTTWNYVGLDSLYVNQLVNCGGDTTYALTAGQGVYKPCLQWGLLHLCSIYQINFKTLKVQYHFIPIRIMETLRSNITFLTQQPN